MAARWKLWYYYSILLHCSNSSWSWRLEEFRFAPVTNASKNSPLSMLHKVTRSHNCYIQPEKAPTRTGPPREQIETWVDQQMLGPAEIYELLHWNYWFGNDGVTVGVSIAPSHLPGWMRASDTIVPPEIAPQVEVAAADKLTPIVVTVIWEHTKKLWAMTSSCVC